MPSLGTIADDYAAGLEFDTVSVEEVVSWVDSLIADIDNPPYPLVEASISGGNKDKLIAALGEFHFLQLPVDVEVVQQYVKEISSCIPEFTEYWETNEALNYYGDGSSVHGVFFAFIDFVSETQETNSLKNEQSQSKYIEALHSIIDKLYELFACYPPGSPCGYCYSEEEIEVFTKTPLRELNTKIVLNLLFAPPDHGQNSEVYRHYLPRIFESMAPPESCPPGGMHFRPERLIHYLQFQGFNEWPKEEREEVIRYLQLIMPVMELKEEDKIVWIDELVALKGD